MSRHRSEFTLGQSGRGSIPWEWDRVGGVVVMDDGTFAVSLPGIKPCPIVDTLEEAWTMVESWRLMNGLNEDGTKL